MIFWKFGVTTTASQSPRQEELPRDTYGQNAWMVTVVDSPVEGQAARDSMDELSA